LKINTVLLKNEYGLVRILRALANENRFIVFKNLQMGPCFATELNGPLNISRPALGKHVRVLINEELVEQKHVVESGTVKTIYELTDFGRNIAEKINEFTKDIEDVTSKIHMKLSEDLMVIDAQINSTREILKGLEKRLKNYKISRHVYDSLKSDYEKKISDLGRRRREMKKRFRSK